MSNKIWKKYRKVSLHALIVIVCIVCGSTLFAGCKQNKPHTSSHYGYVSYIVRWDSISPRHDTTKNLLRFCFYPADNGPMIQTDTDSAFLRIALAPGKYRLLMYNYGKDNFQLRNRREFENMEVAFQEDENGYSKTASVPVYGAVIHEFEVKPHQDATTTITPTFFTKKVYFKIDIPKEHHAQIRDCRGILSGVSPLLSIPNRTVKRDSTTILSLPFEKNKSGFVGEAVVLDGAHREEKEKVPHKLTLHFTLHNGQTITSTVDMGSHLLNIKRQDIQANIKAFVNSVSEAQINLICESVGIHP
ncbi:MAG: DUF5119 domain-containing protein [Tannerellaceae bacterium]|jgi:hypothetical protein|nr:DUF5119 domain-containing protein [Tannerellaceae bacterium]